MDEKLKSSIKFNLILFFYRCQRKGGMFMTLFNKCYNLSTIYISILSRRDRKGNKKNYSMLKKDLLLRYAYVFFHNNEFGESTIHDIRSTCLLETEDLSLKISNALKSLIKSGLIRSTGKKRKNAKLYCITDRGIYYITHYNKGIK